MQGQRDWSRRPFSLILAISVVISAISIHVVGLFEPVEDALAERRAELLSRPPTGEIVVVEIDARSLSELRSWPWPRQHHAQLVRELDRAGASIIAFDVDFSAHSNSGDEDLASAIRDAGHVVLPIFEQKSTSRESEQTLVANRPTAAFAAAWIGGANIFPNRDGIVREYPAATFIGGAIQPSLATLVAENDRLGDRTFQPDWSIDAFQIPRLSFVDVMNGRISDSQIHGKRVLIGATAVELGDRYVVPRYGIVPGVVIQALAAESLLQERPIQRTGFAVTAIGVLLIALLLRPKPLAQPYRYAALCGGVVTVIIGGPILAQKLWPVSIDSAPWLFTALAAAAVQAFVEARRRLNLRALMDVDSGLPNRSSLELKLGADGATKVMVVTAAIERFEAIRDAIGTASTNEMIRNTAAIVGTEIDGPVFRIAPGVLAWTLPQCAKAAVESTLQRLQAALREPVTTQAGPIDVIMTFGIDREPDGACVLRVERALSAIGTARSTGRSHEYYSGSDPVLRRQLSMMGDLRQAMQEDRLRLVYQPKLALASGRIADVEALIRWHGADGNLVSPDEFIPLAEATGVIREVTIFCLRTALREVASWNAKGISIRVAVNISAVDLATVDIADEIDRLLAEFGVPPSQLALEVTESALIRSPAEAISTLTTLRQRGVRLSVDDYGTGQSTLSYLKHLPVHELKIDKSFVTNLARDDSDAIMVRSTINLAHELGLQVVAEGIEDGSTLDKLRELGCDYAQGYLISKPLGANEFFALASSAASARKVA